MIDNELENKNN